MRSGGLLKHPKNYSSGFSSWCVREDRETMRIGRFEFDTDHHTYVMGILNVTPDSFSDGGKYNTMDQALRHAEEMVAEGADILDIGGESTRPGHERISDQEEIERTVPVLERLRAEFDVLLSIDTYKPVVAQAALGAGVDLINDIWGLKYDARLAEVIACAGAACCLMHNRREAVYQDLMAEVKADLRDTLAVADAAGIPRDRIILDPGVGFGKTCAHNLCVINSLEQLHELGCPVLLGTSRKSVIGLTLELPVEERLAGTLVTTVYAVQKGCAFVRVHDVKENVQAIRMTEAIREAVR